MSSILLFFHFRLWNFNDCKLSKNHFDFNFGENDMDLNDLDITFYNELVGCFSVGDK